jgi:NIL domain
VVPNIRRAHVEDHSGWMILEMAGSSAQLDDAVGYLRDVGCTVNRMEGDVLES